MERILPTHAGATSSEDRHIMESKPWIIYTLWSLGVVAVAVLGGVARLFQDKETNDPITKREWVQYLTASVLAGIILSAVVAQKYGVSLLLIGVAGTAGFGSVQLLGLSVRVLTAIIKKIFPLSEDKK